MPQSALQMASSPPVLKKARKWSGNDHRYDSNRIAAFRRHLRSRRGRWRGSGECQSVRSAGTVSAHLRRTDGSEENLHSDL